MILNIIFPIQQGIKPLIGNEKIINQNFDNKKNCRNNNWLSVNNEAVESRNLIIEIDI